MGKIKASKTAGEHQLTESEFKYVLALNQDRQRVMSAFLNYVAKDRLGYPEKSDLQFELDFADESHTLKVTKLEQ